MTNSRVTHGKKKLAGGMLGGRSGAIVTVSGVSLAMVRGLEHLFGITLEPSLETELVLAMTAGVSLVAGAIPDGLRLIGWDRTADVAGDVLEDGKLTKAESISVVTTAINDEWGGER